MPKARDHQLALWYTAVNILLLYIGIMGLPGNIIHGAAQFDTMLK